LMAQLTNSLIAMLALSYNSGIFKTTD